MLQPFMTVKVARKFMETGDIAVFELADPNGADLPPFSAGSHIDIEVRPGLVRQYSLCNNPVERDRYVLGVLLDPATRGGSEALHQVAEGATLRISEPRNHFKLDGTAERTVLFAGGIGVTPILCMAERLSAIGADFDMHYASRSRSRCAFYDRIQQSSFVDRVHLYFDDEGQKLHMAAALDSPAPGTHAYVCGPAGFIDFVLSSATTLGFPEAQVHREYFNVDTSGAFAEGDAFEIKLSSTGQSYTVPVDRTVLDVLRDNGVELPTSCEQGVCGACLTRVLEGVPDHRDYYLTKAEREVNDQFMPCCSRAKTPVLVLDL